MKEQKHPHISRRSFLKISGGAAALTGVSLPKTLLAQTEEQLSTLIDLSLCDGCLDRETPACVSALQGIIHNDKIPQVIENIPEPWPRKTIEDWSKKKEVSNRLTPYNFIYVHRADIDRRHHCRDIRKPHTKTHSLSPSLPLSPCILVIPDLIRDPEFSFNFPPLTGGHKGDFPFLHYVISKKHSD